MPGRRKSDRLESWKEIAAYLRRTVRTAQRWQQEGLPVHRHHHKKLGSVFAIPDELDAWCRHRAAAGAALTQRDHYYLLSGHHLRSRTIDGLQKSAKYAQLAIERDGSYAPAHGRLALARAILGTYGALPPATPMMQARTAAERALELHPDEPDAYGALGLVSMMYDWDFAAAETSLGRASRLRPSDAATCHWLGLQRLVMGRHDEALRLIAEAHARDPLSPMIGAQHGWFLILLRRYEEAVTVLEAAIDLDPLFFRSYATLAWSYLELGKPDHAAAAVHRAAALNGYPVWVSTLAECQARAGNHDAALATVEELLRTEPFVSPYWTARVYAHINRPDRAFALLRDSVKLREWFVLLLAHEPAFDPIRGDIRYSELTRMVRPGL